MSPNNSLCVESFIKVVQTFLIKVFNKFLNVNLDLSRKLLSESLKMGDIVRENNRLGEETAVLRFEKRTF